MNQGRQEHSDDIAYPSSTAFLLLHLACFAAFWTGVTPRAVVLGVVLYLVRIFAIGAGYHRYFSHRAFRTSRIFQFVLAFLSQYGQTENQQGILRPDATVISTSEVAETFGPQIKLLVVLSAIPTGFLLGVLLAFLKNGIDISSEGYAGAEARSGRVAVLPATKAGYLAADLVATAPQSPFAVAICKLQFGT